MPPSRSDIVEFLRDHEPAYRAVLNEILDRLSRLFDDWEGERRIYRIYSRADKQAGNILKDAWKVHYKILKKPKEFPSTIDVQDIIGITIVVNYVEDVSYVRRVIDSTLADDTGLFFDSRGSLSDKRLKSKIWGERKREKGYYAHHYVLQIPDMPELRDYRCEVQVKTLLHDAWGAKTHDLTYKPTGEVSAGLEKIIEGFGDELQRIEKASENIRKNINNTIERERDIQIKALSFLTPGVVEKCDKNFHHDFYGLAAKIWAEKESLFGCSLESEECWNIFESIEKMWREYGVGRDISRLYAILAAATNNKKIFEITMEKIKSWYWAERSNENFVGRIKARRAAAALYSAVGLRESAVLMDLAAIEESEALLDKLDKKIGLEKDQKFKKELECDKKDLLSFCIGLYANAAYHFSEIIGSDAGNKLRARQECLTNLRTANKLLKELKGFRRIIDNLQTSAEAAQLATLEGAAKIALAKTASDVEEALNLSKTACAALVKKHYKDDKPHKDSEELFLRLQQHRANVKLTNLPHL